MAIWKHDCLECRYLGTLTKPEGTVIDLYIHESLSKDTVLARLSDDPPDYLSCDIKIALAWVKGPLGAAAALSRG
jgi:hypothetical protein